MHFSILISFFLICSLAMPTGRRELTFTKENCHACCNALNLPEEIKNNCNYSCIKKYSSHIKYNSVRDCLRGCNIIAQECRDGCISACESMFIKSNRIRTIIEQGFQDRIHIWE
ncbi:PREDICTED: uncharacterized protein LOC105366201 [Ceratosolen solmsi marchali]|uniref:Uncharacterized protein LOC105366201 n=1 Tax=Ceratosolen solmsi marchali TaxID=326594 RepID=A0AAJ7E074_9HYME|nr:PREDICTED: uncharacterized protein LOC105366201 [Ceratosolen solmsi marchali]